MITKCIIKTDFYNIYSIINDASMAYKGIIPPDRWQEPYMPAKELRSQIDEGVEFWKYTDNNGEILGVMGIQYKKDVTLIRHAYVRTQARQKGVGGQLLLHLVRLTKTPILIGAWKDAEWAISFYKKYGFRQVPEEEKNRLLRIYWTVPERQVETSVVLADPNWISTINTPTL